jgi:hypothetical protein
VFQWLHTPSKGVVVARWLLGVTVGLMVVVTGCVSSDGDSVEMTGSTVPGVQSTVTAATSIAPSTTIPQPTTITTTTTTSSEPPLLEIRDPVHGATVTSRRYTFTGVTDPGCTVTVGGKYEAEVEEDGTWALELMLEPGRNSTTFTATHPTTGLETHQAIRVHYATAIVLRGGGLGVLPFGQDETSTIEILSSLLGPPDYETMCNDLDYCTGAGYGWCRYIRTAEWESERLTIVIADCENRDGSWPEQPQLISWWAGQGSTLRTPEGVGPGSTIGEMQAAYGDRFTVGYDDCFFGLHFIVHSPVLDHPEQRIYGPLPTPPGFELPDDYNTDPSQHDLTPDPSTQVPGFGAGAAQSC